MIYKLDNPFTDRTKLCELKSNYTPYYLTDLATGNSVCFSSYEEFMERNTQNFRGG